MDVTIMNHFFTMDFTAESAPYFTFKDMQADIITSNLAIPNLQRIKDNHYALNLYPQERDSLAWQNLTKNISLQNEQSKDSIKKEYFARQHELSFEDFNKIAKPERKSYLESLAKKAKVTYIYCSDNPDTRNFCGYEWDKIAGFSEIGSAWKKALDSTELDKRYLQSVVTSSLYNFCQIKYPYYENPLLNLNKEIGRNPFGNSLESTKELTTFIITSKLIALQNNKTQHVAWKKAENKDEEKYRRYLQEHDIKQILFFMEFLDNLNTLEIQGKSSETPICFIDRELS